VHLAKALVCKEQQLRSKAQTKTQMPEQSKSAGPQSQQKTQIHPVLKTADSRNRSIEQATGTADSQTLCSHPSNSVGPSLTTRRQVFQRDQCCQYQDPKTGVQCGSRKFLSVDYIQAGIKPTKVIKEDLLSYGHFFSK